MDQKQFDAALSDAEVRLRRLKTLYEQWFQGIERVEPAIPRKDLEDLLARLRREQVGNTAQRFRLQQIVQRHVTFSTHWRRIGRQIEEGTYQRDLLRAQRRAQKTAERDVTALSEVSYDVDIDVDVELGDVMDDVEVAASTALASSKPTNGQPAAVSGSAGAPAVPLPHEHAAVDPPMPMLEIDVSEQLAAERRSAAKRAGRSTQVSAPPLPPGAASGAPPAAIRDAATLSIANGVAGARGAGVPRERSMPPVPAAAGGRADARARPAVPPAAIANTGAAANANAGTSSNATPSAPPLAEARRSVPPRSISPFALPAAGSSRPKPLEPPKAPPPPLAAMTQPPAASQSSDAHRAVTVTAAPAPVRPAPALKAKPSLAQPGQAQAPAPAERAAAKPPAPVGAQAPVAPAPADRVAVKVPAPAAAAAPPAAAGHKPDAGQPVASAVSAPVVTAARAEQKGTDEAPRAATVEARSEQRVAADASSEQRTDATEARSEPRVPAAEPVARTEPKIAPVASPVGHSPEPIARPATHAHRPEPRAAAERTEPRIPVSNGSANAATPAGNFSSADVERVYTQYLAARAKNSERTDNVKRETVEKTIRAMLPQLEQKHAGKKIDFDVVVKDGKVALKPITK